MSENLIKTDVLEANISEAIKGIEDIKKSSTAELDTIKKSLTEKDGKIAELSKSLADTQKAHQEAAQRVEALEKKMHTVNFHTAEKGNPGEVICKFIGNQAGGFPLEEYLDKAGAGDLFKSEEISSLKNTTGPGNNTMVILNKSFVGPYNSQVLPEGAAWNNPAYQSNTIRDRAYLTSNVSSYATRLPIGTTMSAMIPTFTEEPVVGDYLNDRDISEFDLSNPDTLQINLVAETRSRSFKISNLQLRNSMFDIQSLLQQKVERALMRAFNRAFVRGTKTDGIKGFTSYDPWGAAGVYEFKKVEQVASTSVGVLDKTDFIKLETALYSDYRPGAAYFMNRKTWGAIKALSASDGHFFYTNQLFTGVQPLLNGYPVVLFDDMDDVETGTLPIAFGSFSEFYTIIDPGYSLLKIDNNSLANHVKFHTSMSLGGGVTGFDAVKLLKIRAA